MGQKCTKCSTYKEFSDYPKASIKASGYAGECKECKKSRVKTLKQERKKLLYHMHKGKCLDCGIKELDYSFYDFHHLDKTTKNREVKQIIGGALKTLLNEVDKCVMLCPNCHRKRHLKEGW